MDFVRNLVNNGGFRVLIIVICLDTILRNFKSNKGEKSKFINRNRWNNKKSSNVIFNSIFSISR